MTADGKLDGVCGRYVTSRSAADIAAAFQVGRVESEQLTIDYNVAPTKDVPVVLERPAADGAPTRRVRVLRTARWGLVPGWAQNTAIGLRLINARAETVARKPAYRGAFAARRCLLPADGYYEWRGDRPGRRQPYFVRRRDGDGLAMAGLYELWRDPAQPGGDPSGWLWTCTIITAAAEPDLTELHHRMPVVLEPEQHDAWLDAGSTDPARLHRLLNPAHGRFEAYPVSPAVSDVRANGPHLLDPIKPGVTDRGSTQEPLF